MLLQLYDLKEASVLKSVFWKLQTDVKDILENAKP